MGYSILVGQTRPLLDETGAPLATAGVTAPDGSSPPFGGGIVATIHDQDGSLVCTGNSVGEQLFDLHKNGTSAPHTVTVTAAGFDWTLGDPV